MPGTAHFWLWLQTPERVASNIHPFGALAHVPIEAPSPGYPRITTAGSCEKSQIPIFFINYVPCYFWVGEFITLV